MENPWYEGNYLPVPDEITAFDLPVTGRIPEALQGRFLCNSMNLVRQAPYPVTAWAMSDGMIHGVRLRDGRAEWYRNRWVRSPAVASALGEPTRPGRPMQPAVLPDGELAPAINVFGHAGRTLALTEAGLSRPYELTYELSTVGPCDFGGTLYQTYSAHPKRDPATGEIHAASYHPFWGNQVQYTILDVEGRIRHCVDIPVGGPTLMHDLSITENYAVFYDIPMLFDIEAALSGVWPYLWNPDYPFRVGVMPKEGTAQEIRWFGVESCTMYHTLNAYEEGDRLTLDVIRHPRAATNNHAVDGGLLDHIGEGCTTLDRWTIDLATDKVVEETLDDHPQEFPRINDTLVGRRHRYGWLCGLPGDGDRILFSDRLLKHDLVAGRLEEHSFGPNTGVCEPSFVPASPEAGEDEGWLMAYVYNGDQDSSDLVILNGRDFEGEPEAIVHLPRRVPYNSHGNWVPDA